MDQHEANAKIASLHSLSANTLRSTASCMLWRYTHEALWMRARAIVFDVRAWWWRRKP